MVQIHSPRPILLATSNLWNMRAPGTRPGGRWHTFTHRGTSFVPWIREGALDIVQPDVTKVGGISEERKIAWMAEENGIRFIPHGWNTALGLAADLHLASANRNTDLVEYLTGSPFIDDLVESKWELDESGMLQVPNGPGLGIFLNLDAVERHTGQRLA